ncbi:MAG: DEAD/DEAH box helicase [Bacteroidales bacterium]|nr:DEAD/DEAH box helicase [Bacteroidales bacterium]
MTFQELGLSEALLKAIDEAGYVNPMPVQEAVIPFLLQKDKDVVALAQTGTGKTAAYGLPVLQRIGATGLEDSGATTQQEGKEVKAVVLAPTRELCLQIADDLEGFGKYMPDMRLLAVYGGTNIEPQIRALKHGVDIIVATPGRLIDLMNRKAARLDSVQYVVLDEADEMLSMGFQEDIDTILEGVPEDHRTLLFSATMSREIERIASNYLKDAEQIQVGSRNEGAENVNHIYYMVHAKDKYLALKRVVDYYPKIYAIIFCRTRMETQEVADNLIRDGYNADALHGDLSQQQRDLTMQKFRQHRTQLLVATDVAARGLDVDDLTHVINFGMPDDTESYTHRSGRTGRAGKKGTSICIVHVRERGKIKLVEKIIQKEFIKGELPSGKEICAKQLYRVIDDIEHEEVDEEEIADFLPEVNRRWEWLDKEDLIKRVLSREFGRFLQYYANAPEIDAAPDHQNDGKRGKREKGKRTAEAGYARLFVTVGKTDGVYAREMIRLIDANMGEKVEVGRIDLMKNYSFVEVLEQDAQRVMKAINGARVKGRVVRAELADAEGNDAGEAREGRASSESRETKSSRESRNSRETRAPRDSRPSRVSREARTSRDAGAAERPMNRAARRAAAQAEAQVKGKGYGQESAKRKKPSREERGYTEPRGKKYTKEDWMQFVNPGMAKKGKRKKDELVGQEPDFSEEGWARRYPKK